MAPTVFQPKTDNFDSVSSNRTNTYYLKYHVPELLLQNPQLLPTNVFLPE